MRKRFFHILLLMLFSTSAVWAQESGFEKSIEPGSDQDVVINSDDSGSKGDVVTESEKNQQADAQKPREQVFDRDRKPTAQQPDEDESDDDLISFNFLYYIIQKYKMSDIVD